MVEGCVRGEDLEKKGMRKEFSKCFSVEFYV